MVNQKIAFYNDILSRIFPVVSKIEFDPSNEEKVYILTLLSSSIELLDNMCVLASNESKIGIPILLRSIVEAAVDIQFILIKKDNYKRIEIEDVLLWKGIIESAYKGNKYVGDIRNRPTFDIEAKSNTAKLKTLENSGVTKADITSKFKDTIFADAHKSLYAVLCSYAHNGKSAQEERHITTKDGKTGINMFKEISIEEYEKYLFFAVNFIFVSISSINEAFQCRLENEINELREISRPVLFFY